jgi:UDP-3-O-[3-hydroxymyristoyl] glucosamine N-acyltransferase
MKFTAQQIATLVKGRVEGDPQSSVRAFAKIEEGRDGDLCFLANAKYEEFLYTTAASIIIVNESLVLREPIKAALIRVPDAYAAFALLMQTYKDLTAAAPKTGREAHSVVDETAVVHETSFIASFAYIGKHVHIGNGAQIYPNVYIGDHARIGDGTILYAGVCIYDHCVIGKNCIVHAGSVIGSDGFGFAPDNGTFKKIPQMGNVEIEDDVEIGANCTIDRATIGSTRIRKGTKLDNLIQIAHNVEIGESTVIASQSGISGSTKMGSHCMVGGQVGIVGHIRIADGVKINAQSGVSKAIDEPGTSVTGSPAFEYRASLKSQAAIRQLPNLLKRVAELEKLLIERKQETGL